MSFDIDEMLVTFREMQIEQARLDALLIEQVRAQQVRAQQGEPGDEVTAILVSPMIDVGGTSVRARPTVLVAPGLLASLPRRAAPEMTALKRLTAIEARETGALPFTLPPKAEGETEG
jgi:hypothetical protein